MFAVIKTGGKQYRVAPTDVLEIERLNGEAGDAVAFGDVLLVGGDDQVTIGSPLVEGATVAAEIVEHRRSARILVFKKRRRQNSKRTRGHRQDHTVVRITEILTDGAAPKKAKAKAAPKAEAQPKAEAAPKAEAKPKTEAAPKVDAKAEAKPAPAPSKGDDLKKLSGVGPAIEKKLHALGITTFAEVAAWTADDVARVEETLNFKGRVEREDWIAQAKKFAAGEE